MKHINSALRSHRKPAKPEFYQLIVVVDFNRVKIADLQAQNEQFFLFSKLEY